MPNLINKDEIFDNYTRCFQCKETKDGIYYSITKVYKQSLWTYFKSIILQIAGIDCRRQSRVLYCEHCWLTCSGIELHSDPTPDDNDYLESKEI